MTKNLKSQIKNVQIAGAINLHGLKAKLSKKKSEETASSEEIEKTKAKKASRAKTKEEKLPQETAAPQEEKAVVPEVVKEPQPPVIEEKRATPVVVSEKQAEARAPAPAPSQEREVFNKPHTSQPLPPQQRPYTPPSQRREYSSYAHRERTTANDFKTSPSFGRPRPPYDPRQQERRPPSQPGSRPPSSSYPGGGGFRSQPNREGFRPQAPRTPREGGPSPRRFDARTPPPQQDPLDRTRKLERERKEPTKSDIDDLARHMKSKTKEGREVKQRVHGQEKHFDSRLRHGFGAGEEEEQTWRKRRAPKRSFATQEQEIIRPAKVTIRLPITVKELAQEMKLKASQLVSKLFLQGIIVTLNDLLADDTVVQLLGQEFHCQIEIDTSEEERIRITGKTIAEEITEENPANLKLRSPVVAFMGHVDHGKTSLIDAIRKSKRAQTEVGAITQHMGAFKTSTSHGNITILDTPGHEAFSHMRERGAEVTDIVVLVIAGDEGIKQQTLEALKQALDSKATIVVAINKCDKPTFNAENVYRQLADQSLLPEAWGGQTITVNCSALTGEGIPQLLEMIALQSEVLELKANPHARARGTVIESQIYKGLGLVTCVLVQNGTLRMGDCLVFGMYWGRVKSMKDEGGQDLTEAGPSTPALIHGLSGLPDAGEEFIVVSSEKEAREIAEARLQGRRETKFQTVKKTLDSFMEKNQDEVAKKTLHVILRADVHGSLEALKNALMKIESKKADVGIVSMDVGEISESDVQLALASKAVIIGFHTQIEAHAEPLMKEFGVQARLHNIIYHAVDDVKELMKGLLDKIVIEKDKGKATVKAVFKSSHLGNIAGCLVMEGSISRNCVVRVIRNGETVWKGAIASLKRVKEDVKEVQKGIECGIVLQGFQDVKEGDSIEAFEITYQEQEI